MNIHKRTTLPEVEVIEAISVQSVNNPKECYVPQVVMHFAYFPIRYRLQYYLLDWCEKRKNDAIHWGH